MRLLRESFFIYNLIESIAGSSKTIKTPKNILLLGVMTLKEEYKNPHYGWIVAFAAMLIAGAGVGIINSTLGVFIIPVTEELGFYRGSFMLYASISMIVSVLLMPYYGTLFNKYGFKRIALIGAVVCGLVLIGYSFSSFLWHFYVLAFISGVFINGIGIMSVGILVNKWFIDKKGLAIGIAYSGTGLAAALLIPVSNWFIYLNGWRWAFQFLAAVSLFVLIPLILFVVKDKPEDMGLTAYRIKKNDESNAKKEEIATVGLTREQAFRTLSFWLLIVAVMGIPLSQAGPHVHIVAFITDIGYTPHFAAAVSSAYMLLLTVGKVLMGFVLDKLGPLKGSLIIGGCCVIFPILGLFAANPFIPWIFAAVLGIASSGSTMLGNILASSYFGRKDFSRVFSVISMFTSMGVTMAIPLFGLVFDITGGYTVAWIGIICMGIVVCACLAGSYKSSRKLVLT